MAMAFDGQSNANFEELPLIVKNTFLHVSSADSEVADTSRRCSAPDIKWRLEFASNASLSEDIVSEQARCKSSPELTRWHEYALPTDASLSEQTNLVVKNTFLHVPLEHPEVQTNSRRSSAPDFTWRFEFRAMNSPCADAVAEQSNSNGLTTVMMKNIPCSCKKTEVVAALEESGFMALSNFFYIPNRHGKILGYAFIGFPSAEITEQFARAMTGYRFPKKQSTKIVSIVPACVQGLENNLEYFRERAVNQSRDKPFFRDN